MFREGLLSDSSFPSQTCLVFRIRYNRDLGVHLSHLSKPQNYAKHIHSPRVRMLAKSLRVLVFILTLLLCTTSGILQDAHDDDPPSLGGSSNHLSWPSAFWGLVGIAFNTATQPSDSIVGLPSSWGPALKCSPISCIINAFQALNSIRVIRRDFELVLVVAPQKYDADNESNHTDVATLQRNTLFRIIAFILGPVLQATKLYACQGIFWTQFLALCDEFTLSLLWLTGSTASRGSVTGLAEAVLSNCHSTPTSPKTALSNESRGNGNFWINHRAWMTWVPACFFLLWFAGDAVAGVHLEVKTLHDLGTPDLTDWLTVFSLFISTLVLFIVFAVASYNRVRQFWMIGNASLAWMFLPIALAQLVTASATMADTLDNGTVDFNANVTIGRFAWKFLIICTTYGSVDTALSRFGSHDGHGVPKTEVFTLVCWASAHLLTALAMYRYAYDTSRTFQPSWTNVFG